MEETGATGRNHPLIELRPVKRIARVQAMLKQSKKIDGIQRYIEHLNELVITRRANMSTYAEISGSEESFRYRENTEFHGEFKNYE